MIDVCLTASTHDIIKLSSIVKRLQQHLDLRPLPESAAPHAAARLHITDRRLRGPYGVDPDEGVSVSTWDSRGICRYAGIDERTYLLLCSLVGLSQWRVLATNELLRPDDLRHPPGVRCLFATPEMLQDYALILEEPRVCGGCVHFYHSLGADPELISLQEVVAEVRDLQRFGPQQHEKFERDCS